MKAIFVLAFAIVIAKGDEPVPEDVEIYENAEESSLSEEDLARAAVHGHHSLAANPARKYPAPPLPPFLSSHPGSKPAVIYDSETYEPVDDYVAVSNEEYPEKPRYESEEYRPQVDYDEPIVYLKPDLDKIINDLEKLFEGLHLIKDVLNKPNKCPKVPEYAPVAKHTCDPKKWNKCNCLSPATFTDEGRGNCNLGATKMDLKVWCYVEDKNGNPESVCPDSKPSKSKPGYYWSRFACIT